MVDKGYINWAQLEEGLRYQRNHNPNFGEICVERNMLNQAQVDEILAELHAYRHRMLTGEVAEFLGYLTQAQVLEVLELQRAVHMRLGEALIALGYLTQEQVDEALVDMETEHTQF